MKSTIALATNWQSNLYLIFYFTKLLFSNLNSGQVVEYDFFDNKQKPQKWGLVAVALEMYRQRQGRCSFSNRFGLDQTGSIPLAAAGKRKQRTREDSSLQEGSIQTKRSADQRRLTHWAAGPDSAEERRLMPLSFSGASCSPRFSP